MMSRVASQRHIGWLAAAIAALLIYTVSVLAGSSTADASPDGRAAPVQVVNTPLPVDARFGSSRLIDGGTTEGLIIDVAKGGSRHFPVPANAVLTDFIIGVSGGACMIELVRDSEILLTYHNGFGDRSMFDSVSLNSGIVSDGSLEFKVTPITSDQDDPCIVTTLRWTGYELSQ